MGQLELWEIGGRKGGIPPGLREGGKKPRKDRDYRNSHPAYLLRPEVSGLVLKIGKTADLRHYRQLKACSYCGRQRGT